jgi:hypothetical protein
VRRIQGSLIPLRTMRNSRRRNTRKSNGEKDVNEH